LIKPSSVVPVYLYLSNNCRVNALINEVLPELGGPTSSTETLRRGVVPQFNVKSNKGFSIYSDTKIDQFRRHTGTGIHYQYLVRNHVFNVISYDNLQ
jgi:hypothetical protein